MLNETETHKKAHQGLSYRALVLAPLHQHIECKLLIILHLRSNEVFNLTVLNFDIHVNIKRLLEPRWRHHQRIAYRINFKLWRRNRWCRWNITRIGVRTQPSVLSAGLAKSGLVGRSGLWMKSHILPSGLSFFRLPPAVVSCPYMVSLASMTLSGIIPTDRTDRSGPAHCTAPSAANLPNLPTFGPRPVLVGLSLPLPSGPSPPDPPVVAASMPPIAAILHHP